MVLQSQFDVGSQIQYFTDFVNFILSFIKRYPHDMKANFNSFPEKISDYKNNYYILLSLINRPSYFNKYEYVKIHDKCKSSSKSI